MKRFNLNVTHMLHNFVLEKHTTKVVRYEE